MLTFNFSNFSGCVWRFCLFDCLACKITFINESQKILWRNEPAYDRHLQFIVSDAVPNYGKASDVDVMGKCMQRLSC